MDRPELHVLTDADLCRGRTHAEVARAALAGGADVIQLREKSLSRDAVEQEGRSLLGVVRAAGGRLVVNDHLDVALALGADGLHLGEDDLPIREARPLWKGRLGASARAPGTARSLERDGCDYLGVGPVFATSSKHGLPSPIGLEVLARVAGAVRVPVIAIGGIDATNAADAVRAGAAGVAVLAAVAGAEDPRAAARALREALDRA